MGRMPNVSQTGLNQAAAANKRATTPPSQPNKRMPINGNTSAMIKNALQALSTPGGNAQSTRMLAPSQPAKTFQELRSSRWVRPLRMTGPAGRAAGKAAGKAITKGMKAAKGAFNKMKGRGKKIPI